MSGSDFGKAFDKGCVAWVVGYSNYNDKEHYFYKMPYTKGGNNCGKIPWRFLPGYGARGSDYCDHTQNETTWEEDDCRYDWNMEIKCGDSSGVKKVVIHNKPCDDNTRKSFARDDMAGSGWEYFMHQEDEDNEEWYHRGDPKTGKGKYIYVEMYGE